MMFVNSAQGVHADIIVGGKMLTLLYLFGLAFLVSGFLSIFNVTEVGLTYASMTQVHTLPFLSTFPIAWVYVGLGLLLIVIAGGLSRR